MKNYIGLLFLLFSIPGLCQDIEIAGKVTDENDQALIGANIVLKSTTLGTQTDANGNYVIKIQRPDASDSLILLISHVGYVPQEITITLNEKAEYVLDVALKEDIAILEGVDVKGERQREEVSVIKLEPKSIEALPSPFGDFTKVLSTLPGVVSNNELSSTYSVRGGSFDENLVYVNDIPIYRPFLISNGQQEGLSFINTNMVDDVSFSAGGWQPKYGDKLSSVLNVTYKKPKSSGATAYVSLLGAGAHIEGISNNGKVGYLAGVRHKSSQYLLNTLEVEGEYLPKFTDLQSYVNIKLGPADNPDKTTLGILGAYARNRYLIEPTSRETEFGTFTRSLKLFVGFEGRELLEYDTYQGGLKLTHAINDRWITKLITSGVVAYEREFTEVEGGYRLCDVDKNVGSATFNECIVTRGIGTNYDYGRNTLNANIVNIENRNEIQLNDKNDLEFGIGYAYQDIDDQLSEYAFVDSANFVLEESINRTEAKNRITSAYYTAYVQNTTRIRKNITTTYGTRLNYWDLNNQLLISPRVQFSIQPDWVRDVVLKAAVGFYQQQPFYRELRDFNGNLNKDLKAQKSLHVIGGLDYNFRWWNRPFKFLGEVYYKKVYDVIPYDIDNVKVRYYANNNAEAFATGIDLRVSGEFIEDTQSWFSLGILNVRENVEGDGRGYIRRPTDQRVNVGIFFQDHLPNNPTFRVNLSLLFGSGLPFGPPNDFDNRNVFNGDSYRRVDIGFAKQFYLNKEKYGKERWVLLTAEILNLLGTSNPISFTWITDVTDTQIAVPNSLSARFLNVKLSVKI
ncbi:TonB-dependent receptor [Fulvivirga sp. RKSG066]|uniref:TonB-dependent receptor n=1 Tax=Fulvivirga aurantia TaxID=2529383 RepID=UPI0012BCB775|nr:TonB-dependent receptor [Fulvivirga aurantia]MTI22540.1 TonB-dependent receptor [Fulvivirga aurantia]